jgi:hypothetical protein
MLIGPRVHISLTTSAAPWRPRTVIADAHWTTSVIHGHYPDIDFLEGCALSYDRGVTI